MQESSESKGMYSEWTSLSLVVQNCVEANHSVLEKFGLSTSKEVTTGIVKQLASNLGITHAAEPIPLTTDKEVRKKVSNFN